MTKAELVSAIAQETGLTKAKADEVLQSVQNNIRAEVKAGGSITLQGFGTFSKGHREARKGHNPATKQPIDIPAKDVPKFKASPSFMD